MRICLAGTGTSESLIKENTPPFVLESFYYFREWQKYLVKNCEFFVLDSGAFTFMNNTKININWKEYVDKYAEFIRENDIKYFFELDIDVIIGYEEVKKLTKYLEEKAGRKCIPVWHKSRGLDEWYRLVKEYDYVAIGGIVTNEIPRQEYKYFPQLIKIAHQNNCKVHGLGFTSMKWLKKCHFDSVDSTSWLSGGRFGQLHIFRNGNMKQVSYKDKRAINRNKEIDSFNLKEWIKFQNYANKCL